MSSSSTASHSNQSNQSHNSSNRSASASASGSSSKPKAGSKPTTSPHFTPLMQDAQARNKDPYEDYSSDDSEAGEPGRRIEFYAHESYESIQRRREAAIILDNPELLMMHAQARNDSIPGTRYYFTKMLCGYLEEREEYERKAGVEKETDKGKGMAKGKRGSAKGSRVSGGASGSGSRS